MKIALLSDYSIDEYKKYVAMSANCDILQIEDKEINYHRWMHPYPGDWEVRDVFTEEILNNYSNYLTKQELNPYTAVDLIINLGRPQSSGNFEVGNNYWINGENIIYYQRFLKYIDANKDITVTLDASRLDKLAKE
jgi:hypothetical protein